MGVICEGTVVSRFDIQPILRLVLWSFFVGSVGDHPIDRHLAGSLINLGHAVGNFVDEQVAGHIFVEGIQVCLHGWDLVS